MTEEEALLSEVKDIIDSASKKDNEGYIEYIAEVAKSVEQTLYDEYGKLDNYELWCLRMAHKGTTDSVEEFRKIQDPENTKSIDVKHEDHDINSCIEMSAGYMAEQLKLADLNALLDEHRLMLMLQFRDDKELVGLVARTGAWLGSDPDTKPSQDKNKKSITATIYMAGGAMVFMSRDDETGNFMEEAVMSIPVFVPTEKGDEENMMSCVNFLDDKFGRTAAKLYSAWAFPRMLRITDPEMAEALHEDALSAIVDKETEQETAHNPQEKSNDN